MGRNRRFGVAGDSEDFADAGERDGGLAEIGEDAPHLAHRPEHDAKIGDEGEEQADGESALGDPPGADEQGQADLGERHEVTD